MVRPLNTDVPPEPETIRRALRIAEEMPTNGPGPGRPHPDVWLGSADALRWVLGLRASTPLSGRAAAYGPDGLAAWRRSRQVHRRFSGYADSAPSAPRASITSSPWWSVAVSRWSSRRVRAAIP